MPKDDEFSRTIRNASRFTTYTLAIAALLKATKVLQERGADPKAVSFLLSGSDQLVEQLEQAAQTIENKQVVEKFLAEIKIDREGMV